MASRYDIAEEARKWVGVPWRHQGRSRNGVDCAGLAIKVAHALGLSDFDVSGYGRVPSKRMMERLLQEHCDSIPVHQAMVGDLLHMAWSDQPQHIAIISNSNPMRIIHADAVIGHVVEHGLDATWRGMVRGAYRIPL